MNDDAGGTDKLKKTQAEWQAELTPEQFRVTRCAGTEAPFSGEYNDHKQAGSYRCICCKAPLFSSEHKFDSGCGWPSFLSPESNDAVTTHEDDSHGMRRTEVRCAKCEAHLGHVFPDGPAPTSLRYCINSICLDFRSK